MSGTLLQFPCPVIFWALLLSSLFILRLHSYDLSVYYLCTIVEKRRWRLTCHDLKSAFTLRSSVCQSTGVLHLVGWLGLLTRRISGAVSAC